MNRKPARMANLKELAKSQKSSKSMYGALAYSIEQDYIKSLKSEQLLEYIRQRESEVFLDNL